MLALLFAFLFGRLLPERLIVEALEVLRLRRTREMLLRYRCVALAVAVNTPGNIVVGGGGGIALAAGFSRLFSIPAFMLTVMLAVSPLPILILLKAALS